MAEFVIAIIIAVAAILAMFGVVFSGSVPRNPKVWTIIGGIFAVILAGGMIV